MMLFFGWKWRRRRGKIAAPPCAAPRRWRARGAGRGRRSPGRPPGRSRPSGAAVLGQGNLGRNIAESTSPRSMHVYVHTCIIVPNRYFFFAACFPSAVTCHMSPVGSAAPTSSPHTTTHHHPPADAAACAQRVRPSQADPSSRRHDASAQSQRRVRCLHLRYGFQNQSRSLRLVEAIKSSLISSLTEHHKNGNS
jgi:hypothetical protein